MAAHPALPAWAQTPGARSYVTPMTPSDRSVLSREGSWSSVLFTPYRNAHLQGDVHEDAETPIIAPAATQRSAGCYCVALVIAACAAGCEWGIKAPAFFALMGPDWRLFAIARLCLGVGALLPPPSLFRSVRLYLRASLLLRVLLLIATIPALYLVFRSHIKPFTHEQHEMAENAAWLLFAAATFGALLVDAAAAAVPAAVGTHDGFRLEQQLLSEFSVSVPPALLTVLRRRLTMAGDFGTLVLAPALAVAALVASMHCGDVCTRPSPFVLPAAVAATVATLACAAAVVLTAGGRPARCIMPAGSSARAITTLPSFPSLPEVPAGVRSPLARDRRRRGNVGSRRDGDLRGDLREVVSFSPGSPGVCISPNLTPERRLPISTSELALNEALQASVAELAAGRLDAASTKLTRIYDTHPARALGANLRRGWRLKGWLSRTTLLALACVVEDALVSVALPMVCLRLAMPSSAPPPLWAALCTTLAVSALRIGVRLVDCCTEQIRLEREAAKPADADCAVDCAVDCAEDCAAVAARRPRGPRECSRAGRSAGADGCMTPLPRRPEVQVARAAMRLDQQPGAHGPAPAARGSPLRPQQPAPVAPVPMTPPQERYGGRAPLREIRLTPQRLDMAAPHMAAPGAPSWAPGLSRGAVANIQQPEMTCVAAGKLVAAPSAAAAAAGAGPVVCHPAVRPPVAFENGSTQFAQTAPIPVARIEGVSGAGKVASVIGGIGAALAISLGACALPLAFEVSSLLPPLVPAQLHVCIGVAAVLIGIGLSAASGAMRAKLSRMDAMRNPNAKTADWREAVDALRLLGAVLLHPALCAALGSLPLRIALWAAAALVAIGAALAAIGLVYAELCAPYNEYRRAPLLGGDTEEVDTPTLLLSTGCDTTQVGSASCFSRTEAHTSTTPGLSYSMHTDDTE
jgi:hypothetical protein